jgi:acetyl-CoA synthetase
LQECTVDPSTLGYPRRREGAGKTLEALLLEKRRFPAASRLQESRHVSSDVVYRRADRDFERFWERFAEELDWFKTWRKVLDWKPPRAKWFVGGKLNVSVNCLDRHSRGRGATRRRSSGRGARRPRTLTYRDLTARSASSRTSSSRSASARATASRSTCR